MIRNLSKSFTELTSDEKEGVNGGCCFCMPVCAPAPAPEPAPAPTVTCDISVTATISCPPITIPLFSTSCSGADCSSLMSSMGDLSSLLSSLGSSGGCSGYSSLFGK